MSTQMAVFMKKYKAFTRKIAYSVLLAVGLPAISHGQIITTYAGNGEPGVAGDGNFAILANVHYPSGLRFDNKGNLYIADRVYGRIRMVNAYGIITTVVGSGSPGMAGDNGPATNAKINYPNGMAFDAAGNLYFADTRNNRIRKVDTAGIISTVAGNGIPGFSGDDSAAVNAKLYEPAGVAIDKAGNMFISDTKNHRIRKVDPSGIISTVAGRDTSLHAYLGDGIPAVQAILYTPSGIDVAPDGSVVFVDGGNLVVRKISSDGIITKVAGTPNIPGFAGDDGPAVNARLNAPNSLAIDKQGNIFISDGGNFRVRKVGTDGKINTVAGNGNQDQNGYGDGGPAVDATIDRPLCVALDTTGNLFVGEKSNRVRYIYLNEPFAENKITIFPNPGRGNTSIFLPSQYEEVAHVFIINTEGRIVSESILPTNMYKKIAFGVPGNYYIYAVSRRGKWYGKVTSIP